MYNMQCNVVNAIFRDMPRRATRRGIPGSRLKATRLTSPASRLHRAATIPPTSEPAVLLDTWLCSVCQVLRYNRFFTQKSHWLVISTFINVRRVGLYSRGDVNFFVNSCCRESRVPDPWKFEADPDPRIRISAVIKKSQNSLNQGFSKFFFACWIKDPDPRLGGQKTYLSGCGKQRKKIGFGLWELRMHVSENKSELT